jgi:hypothetical protein
LRPQIILVLILEQQVVVERRSRHSRFDMRTITAPLITAALVLSGCAGSEQQLDFADREEIGSTGADTTEANEDESQRDGNQGGASRAAADTGAPDGGSVQTVEAGEAGEVDIRVIDRRQLELVDVREAAGWTHRIDAEERDEIEIDFRHDDGRRVELETEIEDGRLKVEVD